MLFIKKVKKKRIVVIGGGTGVFTVLSGLKKYPLHLSAIVSMADDGGSTGVLREEFGILPPGDIRRVLIALSRKPNHFLAELFSYRFEKGGLKGHNFGNLILTALERITGSFEEAIQKASELLDIEGEVIPVTLDNIRLCAMLDNGKIIKGETNIDIPKHNPSLGIKKVWLKPRGVCNKRAVEVLLNADIIVIGPGDLFTSIIPNLLVKGLPEAIIQSKAKKVYVCNLMTKMGETHGFKAEDFVKTLEKYVKKNVLDYAIFNQAKPSVNLIARYNKEGKFLVEPPADIFNKNLKVIKANLLRKSELVRHHPDKLAKVILSI